MRGLLAIIAALVLASAASASRTLTWQQAVKLPDDARATVCGHVFGAKFVTWKSGKGTMTFLDLGAAYPNSKLTVVAWGMDVSALKGRNICATGTTATYKGQRELDVDSPNAIH
jgi:DNA/RNA endonuclease YhcR with UshA esterase domain